MKIGRFEILEELGHGGMGDVYKAFDTSLERPVAIKKLKRVTEEYLERFRQEAKTAGRLQHENITIVYESGDESGEPFIVMEFLDGDSLRTLIQERIVGEIPKKLEIIRQVLAGLDYAHAQGIASHRDIKPANIQVTASGRVKIMDFGIAKLVDEFKVARNLTERNTVLGTLFYLSPEQIRGERLDGRSDIWAVGVVLYEFLYGDRPFDDPDDNTVMKKIVMEELAELRPLQWTEEEEVHRILRKALEKDRDRRYASAGEMAAELAACVRRSVTSGVYVPRARKSAKQYFDEGREHYNAGHFNRAIEAFRKVLEAKPGHRGAIANIEICERAQRSKHAEELKRLGILLFKNREWRLAIASLEELLGIEPADEDARTLISWARRELRRLEEQKEDLSDLANKTLASLGWQETVVPEDPAGELSETGSLPAAGGAPAASGSRDAKRSPRVRERLVSDSMAIEVRDRSTSRVSAWFRRLIGR